MKAVLSLVLLLVPLAAPTAQADWLQAGVDAARTGYTDENAPTWGDVAYTLRFDVNTEREFPVPVIIVDGHAYIGAWQWPSHATIWRVELATARWEEFARPTVPSPMAAANPGRYEVRSPLEFASDGESLFSLFDGGEVQAFDLATGTMEWRLRLGDVNTVDDAVWPADYLDPKQSCRRGAELAVVEGALFAACDVAQANGVVIARIDPAGTVVWSHVVEASGRLEPPTNPNDVTQTVSGVIVPLPHQVAYPTGLSVLGDRLVVALRHDEGRPSVEDLAGPPAPGVGLATYHAFDVDGSGMGPTGHERWWATALFGQAVWAPAAVQWGDEVVLELGTLGVRKAGNDTQQGCSGQGRCVPFRPNEPLHEQGAGFIVAPEGLYATSQHTLHLLDEGYATAQSFTLPTGSQWAPGSLVRTADDIIIGRTGAAGSHFLDGHNGLVAIDRVTMQQLWSHHKDESFSFAVSDGFVALWSFDGVLEVIGHGPIALQLVADVSARYPQPGDVVRVDLSRSLAGNGAFGGPDQYRAEWGDGSNSEWQESPVFEHQYAEPVDTAARFYARNANQTASVPMTFHVGQTDPSINIFNSPFSDQYQETTFFFLGLLITALAALIGIYRAGRKRRRLERELRELETEYKILQAEGTACESMLGERRARARALFLERKLEEAHASFLVTRIDELRHGLRMNEVEQRLDFLPLGMVKTLREMLRDSRITDWERGQFLQVLERDTLMTTKQKAQVRGVIEGWFASDTQGTG